LKHRGTSFLKKLKFLGFPYASFTKNIPKI
jgi:hypothetical protein